MIHSYAESIYAGVVGKMLGVYLGRPVEGWTYEKINGNFGQVDFFINDRTGAPLIVPDDDISGTFVFVRALEDHGYPKDITAAQIGDAWLNYIIENKTILWWGGLSRSTEHTAYLRLKAGIEAPASGSIELNGRSMAEQIGAEIFIDTWALVNPGNPGLAAEMARKAASVSHDGIAVEAAVFLAAMEAMAFETRDLNTLIDRGLSYVQSDLLKQLVTDIREQCALHQDWRAVRNWIAKHHSYERYPGNCPMVTNHLVVLMALLLGGDDFQKSIAIAVSAGWDTDCNAGNVGCLNGIRLGLSGIDAGADLRKPVSDRMYMVSADGGSCLTDAVLETRKLIKAAATLRGESFNLPATRFAFEYPGSTQGFLPYPAAGLGQGLTWLGNAQAEKGETGLLLKYSLGRGQRALASVDTYVDLKPKGIEGTSYFEVFASPSLYATQKVQAIFQAEGPVCPSVRLFVDYYNAKDQIETAYSPLQTLQPGQNSMAWEVPSTGGFPVYRIGVELSHDTRLDSEIILKSLDWSQAPRHFELLRSMEMSPDLTPWTTETTWLQSFMSSALNFHPDYTTTFSISHPDEHGVVTTGTSDWRDYAVASTLTLAKQNAAGLIARAKGHRRFYAAILRDGQCQIIKRQDKVETIVAATDFAFSIDQSYHLRFELLGDNLSVLIDGHRIIAGQDSDYLAGGAGFLVDSGAILADRFLVERLDR